MSIGSSSMLCRLRKLLSLSPLLLAGFLGAQQPSAPAELLPFQNPTLSIDARITDLLGRMNLEEKIQAFSTNPTIPRLGVVGTGQVEGAHGLALGGPAHWEGKGQQVLATTQFPQTRGLGQTWDPDLLRQAAALEAAEARYADGKYHRGGLVVRAPDADLERDPRLGRSGGTFGEDPFLAGTLAGAFSRGLQGADNSRFWTAASLLRNFLANSNGPDGREGSSSAVDDRVFHEFYAVPFRMAIQEGGAAALMTSSSAWNGTPMTVSPALHEDVAKQWSFDGIFVSDAGALTDLVTRFHRYKTVTEAAAAAVHAGINQFLDDVRGPLRDALAAKLLTESDLDNNLRGVFRVMLRLGMLDPPASVPQRMIGVFGLTTTDPWFTPESRALALHVTHESIVLLKNDPAVPTEAPLLPLDSAKIKSVAVVGPLADRVALDAYSGTPPFAITPLEGIRQRAGKDVTVTGDTGADLAAAAALAAKSDIAVVVVGNHPACEAGWEQCPGGKPAIDRRSLSLGEEDLVRAVLAANPHTVVVLQTSFSYTTIWTQAHVPAILAMAHNSEVQGIALADVLFGDYNPAGRLTQTWVASEDQLPAIAADDIRHGRTYQYLKTRPLYAFGFGLSFAKFHYATLRLSSGHLAPGKSITASVDITNTSDRAGDEVVQLYIAHTDSKVVRPLQELKAFARVTVGPGETRTVTLHLPAASLMYWNGTERNFALERDAVEVRVGGASDNIQLREPLLVGGGTPDRTLPGPKRKLKL